MDNSKQKTEKDIILITYGEVECKRGTRLTNDQLATSVKEKAKPFHKDLIRICSSTEMRAVELASLCAEKLNIRKLDICQSRNWNARSCDDRGIPYFEELLRMPQKCLIIIASPGCINRILSEYHQEDRCSYSEGIHLRMG